MQVELAGEEAVAGDSLAGFRGRGLGPLAAGACGFLGCGVRKRPVAGVELCQFAAKGDARELLEQQATLASAAEAKLADELLVAGPVRGAALDQADQLAVGMGVGRGRLGHRLSRSELLYISIISREE